jgi:hypothetical protein
VLQAENPEKAQEIEHYAQFAKNNQRHGGISQKLDSLLVSECWTLPCGNVKGKHIITAGEVVLLHEEWDRDYFPIVKIDYTPPVVGFYPRGLGHILKTIQYEYDDVVNRMKDAQHLISNPHILLREGGSLQPSDISNEITVLEVSDLADVQVMNPISIAGDTFNYAATIKNTAFEISGVSQLAAMSRIPPGIDGASGKALREYNDMETERFASLAISWERMHKEIGEIILREMAYCDKDFIVKVVGKNTPIQEIKYSDLDLDIDDIIVQIFAVPDLPSKPAGKIAYMEELTQSGYLTPEEAADLSGQPDIDATLELKKAPRRAVDKIINRVLNDPNYDPFDYIDAYLDLEYMKVQATLHYNNVFANDDEDSAESQAIMDKLKQILITVDSMIQQATPPAPEGAMMPPMEGGVAPMPQGGGMESAPVPPEMAALMGI